MLHKIAQKIIRSSFDFAVHLIESFSAMDTYDKKLQTLRKYEQGTLGKAIADCLEEQNLRLVPKFESHDLKHVLLNYKMDPIGEIRLQAFLVGNGNISIPSIAILIFGAVLLPSQWKILLGDFRKGSNTVSISSWSIETHAHLDLNTLQSELETTQLKSKRTISVRFITKVSAFSAISAGVIGMFYCLPFLFSEKMTDLVGAGFPFLGGAILAIGGLIALSNLSKQVTTT